MEGGISFKGIKIPPINNKGNFTRFIITIMSDVISVGLADIKSPNMEPRIAINEIPMKIMNTESGEEINMGNRVMKIVPIVEVIMME